MPASCVCPLVVPVKEILRIRRKYRGIVQREDMTKAEFYALSGTYNQPAVECCWLKWIYESNTKGLSCTVFGWMAAIAVNPLRDRLFASLELSDTKTIPFGVRISIYSTYHCCSVSIFVILEYRGTPTDNFSRSDEKIAFCWTGIRQVRVNFQLPQLPRNQAKR